LESNYEAYDQDFRPGLENRNVPGRAKPIHTAPSGAGDVKRSKNRFPEG
jgi:hypothetical protein